MSILGADQLPPSPGEPGGCQGLSRPLQRTPQLLPDLQEECFPSAGSDKWQEGELFYVLGSSLEVSTLNISPLSAP